MAPKVKQLVTTVTSNNNGTQTVCKNTSDEACSTAIATGFLRKCYTRWAWLSHGRPAAYLFRHTLPGAQHVLRALGGRMDRLISVFYYLRCVAMLVHGLRVEIEYQVLYLRVPCQIYGLSCGLDILWINVQVRW